MNYFKQPVVRELLILDLMVNSEFEKKKQKTNENCLQVPNFKPQVLIPVHGTVGLTPPEKVILLKELIPFFLTLQQGWSCGKRL